MKFIGKYVVEGIKNTTISECLAYCKSKTILGIDIETTPKYKQGTFDETIYRGGLDPYLTEIVMLQIGDLDMQYIIDVRDFSKEELQPLIDFIHWNEDVTFIGQNLKFEGKHLRHNYDIRLKRVYDTMLAEISLYNGLNIGLSMEAMSKKYLNYKSSNSFDLFNQIKVKSISSINEHSDYSITPFELEELNIIDKSIRLGFLKIEDNPFSYEQCKYGAEDIVIPFQIREEQLKGHDLLGFHFCNESNINFESAYTQVVADMELNGMPFNVEKWRELHAKNKKIYYNRLDILNKYVVSNYPKFGQTSLFNPLGDCIIDWSSPSQVIAFFRSLGICDKEKSKQTKRMEWSVGAKAVLATSPFKKNYLTDTDIEIECLDSLKMAYLLVRKSQMNITTYGLDFLKYVHPITGRLHPNYRQHLISSRTATTKPNLLAIPGSHRDAFHAGDKCLVVNDYSSQESVVIAALSQDESLLDFFNNGHELFGSDFHSYTAQLVGEVSDPDFKIYPDSHDKYEKWMKGVRQNTKSINFGLAYGITAISLSKQLGISKEEAEELVKDYFSAFPKLESFIKDSMDNALNNGYVIFEPNLKAIYIQDGYKDIKEKEEYCRSFFFNDMYKALLPSQRELYKTKLYKDKPHIKEYYTDIGLFKSKLGNRGCNLKIQGTSAKQSKLAQIRCRIHSIEHPELDWDILLLLHDEIASETTWDNADTVKDLQNTYMVQAANFFCPDLSFRTSGETSYVWEH
jgi:DNA polymerase I-like protein with 3'-5' exonuclease and polymerase domains